MYHYSLKEVVSENKKLCSEVHMYKSNTKQLENINQMLKDEHQALQLAYSVLEEKLRSEQVGKGWKSPIFIKHVNLVNNIYVKLLKWLV